MPAKTGSRNGLAYGWALGENNWNVGMDGNLSFIDRFGLHLSFKSFLNTPPGSPAAGDCHVIDAAPTGAWVGKTGQVAVYDDGAWRYGLPRTGWLAYCEADDSLYVFDGVWSIASGGSEVISGTYTPTLTNQTNVASSTAYPCQYMRVGNAVTVSGRISVTPTAAAGTQTVLGMSLPIASDLTAPSHLGGAGAYVTSTAASSTFSGFQADTANDRAAIYFNANVASDQDHFFSFTYQVL